MIHFTSNFFNLNAPEYLPRTDQPAELTLEDRKCGFEIVTNTKSNIDLFSPDQQVVIQKILSRPSLQTSIVSPSGFFRVHYDQTGFNRPSYISSLSADQNAAEVAKSLDSVYNFEVNYLGYLPPPSEITLLETTINMMSIFKAKVLDCMATLNRKVKLVSDNWTSFIVIDNDYIGYYSTGINGMLVTVAHEFHHSIQVGNYSAGC